MRTRRHKLQVSTFPFLAVLLCAMGALLLVLLVMDRRAHDAARFRAVQAARRSADEAGREAEARHTALERQRQEAQAARQRERQAAHARLAAQESDVQKEIRLVREELARAARRLRTEQDDEAALKKKTEAEHAKAGEEERALAGVRAEEAAKAARSETSRKELEQMTAALARLEKNLADLKEARKREENTYSVVPYNGKRGENRRPVYVECAAGRVVFHPDRTPLDEPLNPSALQAEVDRRLARQKERLPAAQAAAFTPYLMLLIRPDGVSTYYRFRETLQNYKIDFGYEFVDKDWVLDFPEDGRDGPSPSWMTAAKPSTADPATPPSPDAVAHRLHGVAPSPGEGGPLALNPGGPSPGLPGFAPSLASGAANSVGSGDVSSSSPDALTHRLHGIAPTAGDGGGGPAAPGASGPSPGLPGFAPSLASGAANSIGSGDVSSPPPDGKGGPNVGSNGPSLPGPQDAGPGSSVTGPSGSPQQRAPTGGSPNGDVAGAGGSPGLTRPGNPRAITVEPPTLPPPAVPPPPDQPLGPLVGGPRTGGAAPATAGSGVAKPKPPSTWATQGNQAAPGSTGTAPSSGASTSSAAPGSTDVAQNPPTGSPDAGSRTTGAGKGAADGPDDDPFLRSPPPPPLPIKTHQTAPLRPARLSGDRDWIIYVECKPEGVVVYPTRTLVPLSALNRPAGSNPLPQTIQQLIDRKQATVRRGEMPYRPEVRFLVRPEAERTYHLAYPTLDGLAAPKTSQNLGPEDDVSAVVAGH